MTTHRSPWADEWQRTPPRSMAVFASREAAEDFARNDPFVLNGVVRDWQIREWDEAFA